MTDFPLIDASLTVVPGLAFCPAWMNADTTLLASAPFTRKAPIVTPLSVLAATAKLTSFGDFPIWPRAS